MEKKTEKNHHDRWLGDLSVQAENIGFQPEEMPICPKCKRTNPPTRLDCLYCGAELELTEAQSQIVKPNLRKLENWEKGFNLIFSDASNSGEAKLSEIAKMLKCERELLQKLLEMKKPLPLVRAESEREAEIIQNRLRELGIETFLISDESLTIEKTSRRLRGIEFFDDKIIFVLFNEDKIIEISSSELVLVVTGAVFERRVEAVEKRVKKGESKTLQTAETSSDEFLIDIYKRDDATAYRIFAKGFDFSCLETEKGILAAENLKKLARKLLAVAPEAKFVDDYLSSRELLGAIWQVEERTDSQGMKRESFGRFHLENVTTINNLSQFTKYSRLQQKLL